MTKFGCLKARMLLRTLGLCRDRIGTMGVHARIGIWVCCSVANLGVQGDKILTSNYSIIYATLRALAKARSIKMSMSRYPTTYTGPYNTVRQRRGLKFLPKPQKYVAFMAIIMGLGLLFYILLGFRYSLHPQALNSTPKHLTRQKWGRRQHPSRRQWPVPTLICRLVCGFGYLPKGPKDPNTRV